MHSETDVEPLLRRLVDDRTDAVGMLVALVDWLRPVNSANVAQVVERIDTLVVAFEEQPERRACICGRLHEWIAGARHLNLCAEVGIFSRRGFISELGRRLYERVLPTPPDRDNLRDVLSLVFHDPADIRWVAAVSEDTWLRLVDALRLRSVEGEEALERARDEQLYALEMLSLWLAAEELEPELIRLDPDIVEKDSPFVAQQREVAAFVQACRGGIEGRGSGRPDSARIQVLLDQCAEQVSRFRSRALEKGTSIRLTYLLERLDQTLLRIRALLKVLDAPDMHEAGVAAVSLFKRLVAAAALRHSVSHLWRENVRLLSRSVTENASGSGEHYITRNAVEYLRMLRSGAGAGAIIAIMAILKLQIAGLGLAPLPETILICLNYGLGFVLIHVLHFTVATKQPAMTAAAIAEAVEKSDTGRADLGRLAELLIQVGRSQFIAVVGNVVAALPVAVLTGWLYVLYFGAPVLDSAGADNELNELRPFAGLALFHAAIAGVWLFLAGLISGFFDNRCAYLDLPGRLRRHPLLQGRLSRQRRDALADYVAGNHGALAGNFFFGVLLGGTAFVGYVVGLPLDIRHVAFAAANLGYVVISVPPGLLELLFYFLCVILIAAVNLWVSFGLALYVALNARETRIGNPVHLFGAYIRRLRRRPLEFLFPPSSAVGKGGGSPSADNRR